MLNKPEITVLGLDVGGTQVRVALAKGRRVVASQATTWPPDSSPADDVRFVAEQALSLIRTSELAGPPCAAGVALAALTDHEGTIVQWPNRPAWRGLAFRRLLERELAMPIVVEDDANAAALAEWMLGAGQGYRHVVIMMVGTGVGAGLILDGELFRGRHGWAGELGHLVVLPDGPPCPCGHRGCLQMLASGRALERAASAHGLSGAPDVVAAAERGDTWAHEELAACGRWLGLAVANVANLLDLEAVIVGGGLSALGPPWWSSLDETLQANLLNRSHRGIALHRATLPDTAGLLGAVVLAERMVEQGQGHPEDAQG